MSYFKRLLSAILSLFIILAMLVGCASTSPIVQTKHVLILPDDDLLVNCPIEAPPTADAYLNIRGTAIQKAEQREQLQTGMNLSNLKNLSACNKRWQKLREWKATMQKELADKKE